MLIFARFEFDSAIYCNFSFVLSFIYLLIVIRGSFTFGRLFAFIFAHSQWAFYDASGKTKHIMKEAERTITN